MSRISILPVIHFRDTEQAMRNASIAAEAGADGVLLIQMEGMNAALARTGAKIKQDYPALLVGANHLGEHPAYGLTRNLESNLDMTWTDDQLTHSDRSNDDTLHMIKMRLPKGHLYFAGVAFKHQRLESFPRNAALQSLKAGLIPTTSGSATGVAADLSHLANLREGIGNAPLAVASGVTPDNFDAHAPFVSHVLVATGISSSFYEFNRQLLGDLIQRRDNIASKAPSYTGQETKDSKEENS